MYLNRLKFALQETLLLDSLHLFIFYFYQNTDLSINIIIYNLNIF